MFNPSHRGSWRSSLMCIVVIILYLIFMPFDGNFTYPIFLAHPALFGILIYGGITLFFIIGIIWRPNFRRPHKQTKEEEEEEEEEQQQEVSGSRWANF